MLLHGLNVIVCLIGLQASSPFYFILKSHIQLSDLNITADLVHNVGLSVSFINTTFELQKYVMKNLI